MANPIDTINNKVTTATNSMYGNKPVTATPETVQGPQPFIGPVRQPVVPKITPTVTPPVDTTITADKLKGTQAYVLPEPTIDNTPNKVGTIVDQFKSGQNLSYEQGLKDIKDKYNNTDEVTNLMKQISGVESSQQDEANKLQAQENLQAYKKYTTDIDLENERTRQAIENIQKNNPTGALRGGQQDLIDNIKRDSSNRLAILTIQKSAALGDYNTAIETAKAKVDMQVAPLKAQLEQLKYVQEYNKDFQTAEINMLIKKKENEIQREQDRLTKGEEMIINALAQGASPTATSKARQLLQEGKTLTEVASSLGKYAGDYLGNEIKRSTIAKNYADAEKTMKELKGLSIDTSTLPNTTNGFVTKLAASAKNSKDLDATERQSLSKARTVIGQLDSLQSNISKQNGTGLIKGKVGNLFEKFGSNADVGTINAQLQAIVPNLARGTYGEVGVLTDNDIANYRKTLPRLDRPQDQNDAVMALTLKTVLNSMENTLSGAANSNINVSGWTQDYIKIKDQINTIEDRIGVAKEAVNTLVSQDPNLLPAVKEMYQNGFSDREVLEALNAD